MPPQDTINTVNACEGYSNLSKTEGFLSNFHWIIQHCLPDTLHLAGEKDMSLLQSCQKSWNVWTSDRHLQGRRGKSHLQRGISTFAAGSREQWGAENRQKVPKVNRRKWYALSVDFQVKEVKEWCFSMFFPEMCYRCVDNAIGLHSCSIYFWISDTQQQEAVEVGCSIGGAHVQWVSSIGCASSSRFTWYTDMN